MGVWVRKEMDMDMDMEMEMVSEMRKGNRKVTVQVKGSSKLKVLGERKVELKF